MLRMTPLCIVERVVVLVMELPKKRLSTQGGFETQIQTLSGLQAGQQASQVVRAFSKGSDPVLRS